MIHKKSRGKEKRVEVKIVNRLSVFYFTSLAQGGSQVEELVHSEERNSDITGPVRKSLSKGAQLCMQILQFRVSTNGTNGVVQI